MRRALLESADCDLKNAGNMIALQCQNIKRSAVLDPNCG
jgi:hypothetical protein